MKIERSRNRLQNNFLASRTEMLHWKIIDDNLQIQPVALIFINYLFNTLYSFVGHVCSIEFVFPLD